MKSEYDYDSDPMRRRPLTTNVIDHRPSLLRSTRELMNRSPSSSSPVRSPKLPMQEIYRSLMQNRPNINIEKMMVKQRHLENLSKAVESKSSMIKPVRTKTTELQNDIQRKPTVKATPSVYRQKNCDGCAYRRQVFDRKFEFEESKTGENNNTCPINYSTSRRGNYQRSNYINDKPSWKFGRQNSSASSYASTANDTISSALSTGRSHWSSGFGMSGQIGSPRSVISAGADTSTHSKNRNNKIISRLTPKPEALKKIFIVNGSVVSFNGYGFESFTNWFGDETMLRGESKKIKSIVHKELDMSGFTNQEIQMKLYDGNKLVVEATRPLRGRFPAMRFKEIILLPKGLSVESLIVCRTKSGRLVIEDIARPYSQSAQKESIGIGSTV